MTSIWVDYLFSKNWIRPSQSLIGDKDLTFRNISLIIFLDWDFKIEILSMASRIFTFVGPWLCERHPWSSSVLCSYPRSTNGSWQKFELNWDVLSGRFLNLSKHSVLESSISPLILFKTDRRRTDDQFRIWDGFGIVEVRNLN